MKRKEEIYNWIKIGGLLSSIPFILACGPVIGYFTGDYLKNKFNLNAGVTLIFIAAGFAFSLSETIKIISIMLKANKKL